MEDYKLSPATTELLTLLLRVMGTTFAGILLEQGLIDQGGTEKIVGGFILLGLTFAGGLYSWYKRRQKIVTALAAPAGTTEKELTHLINDPNVTTPPILKEADPLASGKARPYLGTGDGGGGASVTSQTIINAVRESEEKK